MMQLCEFLHNLHFDVDKVRPPDLPVDWEDAPLPFKLYQNLPAIPLSRHISSDWPSSGPQGQQSVGIKELGDFLLISYGLTQLCHVLLPGIQEDGSPATMQMLRRYVPSGGGLYPSELYVYLKIAGLAAGIYHYDVAHHRLLLLREGNFDDYLERALGHRCDMAPCFATLFVTTMFWKNFYKYHSFSYRLQALDAGVLIGQLLEVAKQTGCDSSVYLQFLDRPINRLLGLCDREESAYAVIPLALTGGAMRLAGSDVQLSTCIESADALCSQLTELHHSSYRKSEHPAAYPLLLEMNEASMLNTTRSITQIPALHGRSRCRDGTLVSLPQARTVKSSFAQACRQRFSPAHDFIPGHVGLAEMSSLLWDTIGRFAPVSDLDGNRRAPNLRISIAACVHGVDGLDDGAYLYDAHAHGLHLQRTGDFRMRLQQGLSMPTVNLFQAPLCLHLIGHRDYHRNTFGYRGYRMQQMEVGTVLQRLLLSASGLGMAGHPLLGYDEAICDEIYGLDDRGETCLIQVLVGFYRKRTRFEGALQE